MMFKIFIVEDDPVIASACERQIDKWGMQAQCAVNLQNVLAEFLEFGAQLVLMDISLPFYDGYHWCTELRKISKVPIIFLSSASDKMNIVMAMNMGADDFIAKPFDLDVLISKIQALLRRTYDFGEVGAYLTHRGAVLDLSEAVLKYGDERIELTKNEYRILHTLMENIGKIVSRDVLMRRLWETDSFVDENTLSVNMGRLRKKLSDAGLTDFIKTKKGLGYFIE